MKEYPEQHQRGIISIENLEELSMVTRGDLGIQIAKDGRVWVCINGMAFLRFKPMPDEKKKEKKGGDIE